MSDRGELLAALRETDPERLDELWRAADRVRREAVGDEVHLRGLVELSSHCVRQCAYCGLRRANRTLERYRMTADEVMACAHDAVRGGYGTVVLQAGEDPGLGAEWVAELVRRLRAETPLAVTLSLGERDEHELERWRQAGADRYLLRFETSNPALYRRVHPAAPRRSSDRLALLRRLREIGYEIGSGVMVGLPGQSWADLARDLELFAELDLDMIGVGPFIPHPATPLGRTPVTDSGEQVPNDALTTLKVVALSRLACPRSNIPATTALAAVDPAHGRELGLARGANVVMPNLTPPVYRAAYQIYPGKACAAETAEHCRVGLAQRVHALGRRLGSGRGDAPARHARDPETTP